MQIGKTGTAESHICQAYPDRVEVRGLDLCRDLMGQMSFTEYFHLLLTGRKPTETQRDFLDLLLVAIAEHGMMPTSIAARLTLAADPGSLQGALAAGLLGCGPVILGTAEGCAKLLGEAQAKVLAGGDIKIVAEQMARDIKSAGGKAPGFGHPVHRPLDPRTERILELADQRDVSGPHVALARQFRLAIAKFMWHQSTVSRHLVDFSVSVLAIQLFRINAAGGSGGLHLLFLVNANKLR